MLVFWDAWLGDPLASMVYGLSWAFLIVVGELEALWW